MIRSMRILAAVLSVALAFGPLAATAQVASPHAIEIPKWFSESFLDLRDDVRDAAKEGRRLMLYFGQDGCPYCKALMKVNFGDPGIVAATRKSFIAVALNIWGDREVTWLDGRTMPEKDLARLLRVQATPTLLFFDEQGEVVLRLNGWHPPERFKVALEYARLPKAGRPAYADYLAGRTGAPKLKTEEDLAPALAKGKPVLVMVTRAGCKECEELEREGFRRPEIVQALRDFTVVRRDPSGAWAAARNITYTPSLVFLDTAGKEAFRVEGYVRPFHLAASIDYVASGGYRTEPSYQRWLQARADKMHAAGQPVDLWK
jgi:thioredoxin-related protein